MESTSFKTGPTLYGACTSLLKGLDSMSLTRARDTRCSVPVRIFLEFSPFVSFQTFSSRNFDNFLWNLSENSDLYKGSNCFQGSSNGLGNIASMSVDDENNLYILSLNGVHKVVEPSKCGITCTATIQTNQPVSASPTSTTTTVTPVKNSGSNQGGSSGSTGTWFKTSENFLGILMEFSDDFQALATQTLEILGTPEVPTMEALVTPETPAVPAPETPVTKATMETQELLHQWRRMPIEDKLAVDMYFQLVSWWLFLLSHLWYKFNNKM